MKFSFELFSILINKFIVKKTETELEQDIRESQHTKNNFKIYINIYY